MVEISGNEESNRPGGRLPWFIDVFLYPTSRVGLGMLGLFVLVPFLLSLAVWGFALLINGLGGDLAFLIGVLAKEVVSGINAIVTLYMFWYVGLCIRESAEGNYRAPNSLASDSDEIWGMVEQTLLIAGTTAVCLLPGIAYYLVQNTVDGRFWLLLAGGGFFLPMALLSVVMQDGFWGLNPLRIMLSILRAFPRYLFVVPVFYAPLAIIACFVIYLGQTDNMFISLVFRAVYVYLLIVAAHVLGRFFYRNEERLDWF